MLLSPPSSSSLRPCSSPVTTSDNISVPSAAPEDSFDSFAAAISARYAREATSLISLNSPNRPVPQPSLMALVAPTMPAPRPPPMTLSQSLPPIPSSSKTATPVALPPTAFTALPPSSLQAVLSDPEILVLDIRPHNLYVQARIPHALSLSVPSTLLKRPNFPLSRLAEMLPTASARDKFAKWPEASRIVVYDADSAAIPPHTQANNLLGLMRKFRSEGYPATKEVAWLRGGFHAVWRDYPHLVDQTPPPDEADEDEAQDENDVDAEPTPLGISSSAPAAARVLRATHLPKSAFTSASTIPLRPRAMHPPDVPMHVVAPTPALQCEDLLSNAPVPSTSMPSQHSKAGFSLRLPPGLVRPRTNLNMPNSVPKGPLYSMPTLSPQYTHSEHNTYNRVASYSVPGKQVAFNPFFDTIRQNLELGNRHGKGSDGEGIPLKLPRRIRRRVGELPFEWLRQIARKSRHISESSSSTVESDLSDASESASEEGQSSQLSEVPSTSKPFSEGSLQTPQTQKPRSSEIQLSATARRSPRRSPSSSPSNTVAHPSSPVQSLSGGDGSPPSPTTSNHSHSPSDADDLTRALEMQFYKIELGEQKRLLGVMERHSMESGKVIHEGSGVRGTAGVIPAASSSNDTKGPALIGEEALASFPYSITAGLEKGAKNRYRNIWPFEHARVRLRKAKPDDDDYMNASYVQPLGTTKRYIATQGPLPATFADFWTLIWEQNVHVIVMLTREIEGSSVKCGKYWAEGSYGPLRLKLLETNDTPELERKRQDSEMNGGFFSSHVPQPKPKMRPKSRGKGKSTEGDVEMHEEETPSTIKRVFQLTNTAYPLAPSRTVTQFQYLEWPDLNVPDNPRGVLGLMQQVEGAVHQSRCLGQRQWGEGPFHRNLGAPEPTLHGSTAVTRDGLTMDEVDPLTGIALIAQENAPVLLHCSAGVGRTGGYIAVDAVLDGVRREMRKRKQGKMQETADAQAASELEGQTDSPSGSQSQSPGRSRSTSIVSQTPEPMDVDSSPSPPTQPTEEVVGLTMPVSVGDRAVHVPVAGFAEPEAMDVDSREHPPTPVRVALPPPLLQASPELVAEVRRATLNAWPSIASQAPSVAVPPKVDATQARDVRDPSDSSASSGALRGSSQSAQAQRTRSLSSASPPNSQTDSLTSAMVGKTAKLSMTTPSPPSEDRSALASSTDSRLRTMSLPSSASPARNIASHGDGGDKSLVSQSHRLNTWRSEVRSSSEKPHNASETPAPDILKTATKENQRALTDGARPAKPSPPLREPRRLHDNTSPPLLSSYDEPIRRVIEDMREQRMSLCQSLRQYVFVHRAIIEGALMIVDEEKEKGEAKVKGQSRRASTSSPTSKSSVPALLSGKPPTSRRSESFGSSTGLLSMDMHGLSHKRSVPEFVAGNTIMEGVVSSSLGRSKRGASPTELPKEGLDGGVLFTKRPSLKRRQRTNDDKFEPVLYSPPPPSASQ